MKKNIVLSLIAFICLYSLVAYADTMPLDRILSKFSNPHLTSLQKLDLLENYKGTDVKGKGKITDIVKSYGTKDEAMIYMLRTVRGQKYEIVVSVSRESAENIRKGKTINFEGVFTGMSFRTLKLEGGKIIAKAWWWPF